MSVGVNVAVGVGVNVAVNVANGVGVRVNVAVGVGSSEYLSASASRPTVEVTFVTQFDHCLLPQVVICLYAGGVNLRGPTLCCWADQ